MQKCNRNCAKCSNLNGRVDDKGYPFGYECMKYGDTIERKQFNSTKYFTDAEFDDHGVNSLETLTCN